MKKVLIVATVFKFLNFELNDIKILKEMGYEVHVASNMNGADWLKDDGKLDYLDIKKHQIDFGRKPFSSGNFKAYRQLKALLKKNNFDLVHCHTPIAAALTRMAANRYRKKGLNVIYTSHGFHFHKSSSKGSWLIYYTLEKKLASKTDMIITINREDFEVVQNFKVQYKKYIPGVGINIEKINKMKNENERLLSALGIPEQSFVILTIGELSDRKNQETIIKSMAKINNNDIYYLMCGAGSQEQKLKDLSKSLGIESQIKFLGFHEHDWAMQLVHEIDIGAIPSRIEGLGLAGIEMLAAGKPLIGSNVHGINDYLIDDVTGFACSPEDVDGFAKAILCLYQDKDKLKKMSKEAKLMAEKFDIKNVESLMIDNYKIFDLSDKNVAE